MGLGGLEPPTSRLSGARSSQLSYRPRGLRVGKPFTASFILKEPSRMDSVLQNQTASPKISKMDCDSETLTWST